VSKKEESRRQKAVGRPGLRFLPTAECLLPANVRGFSLIELVITIAVLAILTLGTVPMVQVAVKRQNEQELREALRTMREAIDQFHREALAGAQLQVNQQQGNNVNNNNNNNNNRPVPPIFLDSRVRVGITDQTIFTADNVDRYPPDLETLVKGVNVIPLVSTLQQLGGAGLNGTKSVTEQNDALIPKTKIYLRRIILMKHQWLVRW